MDHLHQNEFHAAVRAHEAGDLDGAEAAYRRILAARPEHADAVHLLGVLEHQRGRHDEAIGLITRAIALSPDRAAYHNNLGVVFRALGRPDEVQAAHREALRLDPAYPDALANLGVALHEAGRLDAARPHLEEALRLAPAHVNALFGLANLLRDLGDVGGAVPLYRRALALAPGRVNILNNLGITLATAGDTEGALDACRAAARAAPNDPGVLLALGQALERLDRVDEAADAYAEVARLRPSEGHWPVRIAALCPSVFSSADAVNRYRIGLEAVLDAHRAGLRLSPDEAVVSSCLPSFYLAHHGRDNRALKAKFARLFRHVFPDRDPPARGVESGCIKVGFVATRPDPGMFLRCTAGIVQRLDPDRFRVALFGHPRGLDAMRAAIPRPYAEFLPLSGRLSEAAARVTSACCDVLYHWQVGSDPLAYFLPFTRPAPVQCTGWGTHVTSGIPALAHYISSDLVEPPDGQAYYTEALVRMATLPTYQAPIRRPDPPARRSEFGLPEGRHLYTCLQRPSKIHPDFDAILAEILRRDTAGLIVLIDDGVGRAGERLRARFAATMPDVAGRVTLLPGRSWDAYLRLLSLSDVALDPLHFGGGATAYDALGLGLPLVTWPGARHLGRYVLGCYRKMGLPAPVAESAEDYARLAVQLGTDRAYREGVAARIVERAGVLFEDAEVVREHERFFERALREHSA